MKFCPRASLLFPVLLVCLGCTTANPAASSGTGFLYLVTAGDTTLSAFTIALSNGSLNTDGNTVPTGTAPVAIAITPGGSAAFVANQTAASVSLYSINSDGSLTAGTTALAVGTNPTGLALDPGGKFLFVANQGTSSDPTSGTVSVFSISGTTVTEVAGSPFPTEVVGATTGSGPVSLVVPPVGNYLYVANRFAGTVSAFSFDGTTGALTPVPNSPYAVGLTPQGIAVSRDGNYVFVANSGSNNVSVFSICAAASASCLTPDGSMTSTGPAVSAGQGPVAVAVDQGFNYVYVLNYNSSSVSQYRYSPGTGALTPLSPTSISTGLNPTSLVVVSGATGTNVGSTTLNPTDYVFVANTGAATLSAFTLNTASGVLNVTGQPTTTGGQPSALAAF
jgi:DNA-binding beta-propeller fold protein YncE